MHSQKVRSDSLAWGALLRSCALDMQHGAVPKTQASAGLAHSPVQCSSHQMQIISALDGSSVNGQSLVLPINTNAGSHGVVSSRKALVHVMHTSSSAVSSRSSWESCCAAAASRLTSANGSLTTACQNYKWILSSLGKCWFNKFQTDWFRSPGRACTRQ